MKRPKRLFAAAVTALAMTWFAQPVQAQNKVEEFGVFDHVAIGVSLGTTGIGAEQQVLRCNLEILRLACDKHQSVMQTILITN